MKRYWIDFSDRIKEIEVSKETEKTFTTSDIYGGSPTRHMKSGNYYETWEAAHAELLARYQSKAAYLRKQLEQINGRIGQIKGMKKP